MKDALPWVLFAIIVTIITIPTASLIAMHLDAYRETVSQLERAKTELRQAQRICGRPRFQRAGIVV